MAKIEDIESTTLKPIVISGNNLDIVLWEFKNDGANMDYWATELESNAKVYIVAHGNDYERPEDIRKDICRLRNKSAYLNYIINKIEEAVEKDGSSEIKITYKNQGDSNEE